MKQRVITAAILIAIVFPPVFLGGYYFLALAAAFIAIAIHEIIGVMGSKWPSFFRCSLYLWGEAMLAAAYLDVKYILIASCFLIIYLFTVSEFFEPVSLSDVGILYIYLDIIGFMMAGLFRMYEVNKWLVFFMIIASVLTDSFALFTGMMFGKHKFNERISPKKTIEGCIGGYLFGAVGSFVFGYLMIKNVPFVLILSGALLMPLAGQFGDLAFSEIKRFFGVKDFGKIFPGHGGVNDRIDSISFNSILLYALMLLIL
ncbi:MAG: phosphatidate cytidylyltransferase [Erysipelotrichaceae bacterium]|nr:phosphatidate cytidylyltransferase [Erysipelotrichaceae bacterium]